jgi:tetratricopeptide (TPR) repeat protein
MLMEADRHAEAIAELEAAQCAGGTADARPLRFSTDASLMVACHYAGYSERAIVHGLRAGREIREREGPGSEYRVVRFLGEISFRLRDYPGALRYCEDALTMCRERAEPAGEVALSLFWKARSLFCLERRDEAYRTVEEALALWQEEPGDLTNVGFCLRLLGQICSAQGRFAEARAHLDHAIRLHKESGIEVNRIAAVEVLADVMRQTHRYSTAAALYGECLDFYAARGRDDAVLRLRSRIASCAT